MLQGALLGGGCRFPATDGRMDPGDHPPGLGELGVRHEFLERRDQLRRGGLHLGAPGTEVLGHVVAGEEPRQHSVSAKLLVAQRGRALDRLI